METVGTTPGVSAGDCGSALGEVAEDVMTSMVDQLLEMCEESPPNAGQDDGGPLEGTAVPPRPLPGEGPWPREALDRVAKQQSVIEQLQAELASAKNELDFISLEREEQLKKHDETARVSTAMSDQSKAMEEKLQSAGAERNAAEQELRAAEKSLAEERGEQEALQNQLIRLRGEVERQRMRAQLLVSNQVEAEDSLRGQVELLKAQVSGLDEEVRVQQEQEQSQQMISADQDQPADQVLPSFELSEGQSAEFQPALQAAYQQIAELNTQLAHLYTELTMARTELAQARERGTDGAAMMGGGLEGEDQARALDLERRNGQISDLVSDIRHLQLDLEYHQQKLDQLIDEKQGLMLEMARKEQELKQGRQLLEEKDQLSRHKDIDLQRSRSNSRSTSPAARGRSQAAENNVISDRLRSDLAQKDGALIVSHYELHKEKLVRDKLEQKNMKLMERLQKLMMVVETQRKDAARSGKRLLLAEQVCEDKDQQLAEVTTKARQLQRLLKAQQLKRQRLEQASPRPSSQLKASQQSAWPAHQNATTLPTLASAADFPGAATDRDPLLQHSSMESAGGGAGGVPPMVSGISTPRKPLSPSSIYGGRKRLGY